jgi:hypothetical protein
MKAYTVFLCSTYADLVKERRAVRQGIEKLQQQYNSMEFFGARAARPIQVCLQEVRRSDIVVVVVGHRYGTIEPERGISFAEAEYQEAHRLHKPCLVYIRDQQARVLLEHVEQNAKKKRLLDTFKRTLQQQHACASFRNANGLAVQVIADLSRAFTKLNNHGATLEGPSDILEAERLRNSKPDLKLRIDGAAYRIGMNATSGVIRERLLAVRVRIHIENRGLRDTTVSDYELSLITWSGALKGVRLDMTSRSSPVPASMAEHLPVHKDYPAINKDLLVPNGHGVSCSVLMLFRQTKHIDQQREYDNEATFRLTIADSFGKSWTVERQGARLNGDGGRDAFQNGERF